jgi:hypothetical protein
MPAHTLVAVSALAAPEFLIEIARPSPFCSGSRRGGSDQDTPCARHPLPCPLTSARWSSASSVGPLIRAVEAVTDPAVSQRQPPGVTGASGGQPTARVYGQEPCVSMQPDDHDVAERRPSISRRR